MGKPKLILDDFADMLKFEPEVEPKADSKWTLKTDAGEIKDTGTIGHMEMALDKMKPFPDHKFKLYEGQQLQDMVDSIKQFGILLPIILWEQEGSYTILSGHNRKNAAVLAGVEKAPVIVKTDLTMADATLIVTETNLRQRSFADLSHSERAYCLAQHYEALKSQGKRNDILEELEMLLNPDKQRGEGTCAEVQHKLKSRDKVGHEYGLSRDKVAKYIRLSKLIPALLERVDKGEIPFLAAYDLSFIKDQKEQQKIDDFIESDDFKIDLKKAELLRIYYEQKKLTDTAMVEILSGEKKRKPKSNKPQPIKVKPTIISKYFTGQESKKEIETVIEEALELYFRMQEAHPDNGEQMTREA